MGEPEFLMQVHTGGTVPRSSKSLKDSPGQRLYLDLYLTCEATGARCTESWAVSEICKAEVTHFTFIHISTAK